MIRIFLMYIATIICFIESFDKPLQLLLCYPLFVIITLISVYILENKENEE